MLSLRHRFAFTSLKPTTTIVGPDPSLVLTNPLEELADLVFPLMSIEFEGRNSLDVHATVRTSRRRITTRVVVCRRRFIVSSR